MNDPVKIKCSKNGPYLVRGPLVVVDPTGNEIEIGDGENAALCRCGGSTTKPFCDGTHSKLGFQAAEAAQRAADSG